MKKYCLSFLLTLWTLAAMAEPFAEAVSQAQKDLEAGRQRLSKLHTQQRLQKEKILDHFAQLEEQQIAQQKKRETLDGEREAAEQGTWKKKRQQQLDEELVNQLLGTLRDYRQSFETRISSADAERYAKRLEDIDAALEKSGERPAAALAPVLSLSFERCQNAIGGERFAGAALDTAGIRHEGEYVRFGPLTYFAAGDNDLAGITIQQPNSLLPSVFSRFSEEEKLACQQLFASGQGTVPVDITLGSALQLREATENLEEHLRKGGMTMVPLLLLGGICLLLALYKILVLFPLSGSGGPRKIPEIVAALQAGDEEKAKKLAKKLRRPLSPVIIEGILHFRVDKEHLEEILYEKLLGQTPRLERFLAPLAVCASAAPLLGLLGTVTGMIHTFRLITVFGTGDARLLSSGISEALITTEIGLVIAIPALLLHAWLSRRVRRILSHTQEATITFVNALKLKEPKS